MPELLPNPERLFDRTWRPGHPLRPRLGRLRRWGMLLLFLCLSAAIGGYVYLTDSERVKAMAGSYLSELLGGRVVIARANLSIFEGLRLDGVTVQVDNADAADSTIFSAQTFLIRYNPRELLEGRIQATQIVAVNPVVKLAEDPVTHRWNYQRMRGRKATSRPSPLANPPRPMILPEVILRDAQVEYYEVGRRAPIGWFSLEGRLMPGAEQDHYDFELQSRGREMLGPTAEGSVRMDTGQFTARLKNFVFGPDVKAMLPAEVRAWWEAHGLNGRLDIPELWYKPARGVAEAEFRVETRLDGVQLAVQPQEWLSRRQKANNAWFHEALTEAVRAGWLPHRIAGNVRRLSTPEPLHLQDVSGTFVFTQEGITVNGMVGRLENNWFGIAADIKGYSPDAAGTVTVSSLEGHNLEIPAWSPKIAGSMPAPVQEVYNKLKPQGWCAAKVTLTRPGAGERPTFKGELDILDGSFTFSEFPYPVRNATGKVMIGPDPITHLDGIRILNVDGLGVAGGPNADRHVSVDGFLGPLEDGLVGVDVHVRAVDATLEPALRAALPRAVDRALSVFDPEGRGALPQFRGTFDCSIHRPLGLRQHWTVNTDIDLADAEGTLVSFPYPMKHLSGRLEIRDGYVDILDGKSRKGDARVDIHGRVTWEEPMPGVVLDGGTKPPGQVLTRHVPLRPDIYVSAKNVPIDADLLDALPKGQRDWLRRIGAGGKIDVEGHVFRKPGDPTTAEAAGAAAAAAGIEPVDNTDDTHGPAQTPGYAPAPYPRRRDDDTMNLGYVFDIAVHDGSIWPAEGSFAIADLVGKIHLTPERLDLIDLIGRRGEASVTGHGEIDWGGHAPHVLLTGTARDLRLDADLYRMLPKGAQEGWDQAHPAGTVDADVTFEQTDADRPAPPTAAGDGRAVGASASASGAPLAPAQGAGPVADDAPAAPLPVAASPATAAGNATYRVVIHPRRLTVTPQAVPYRLDDVAGVVTIDNKHVVLTDVTAGHADGRVTLSGVGTFGPGGSWDLKLSGRGVTVDDDLRKAAPTALGAILQSLKLSGKIGFDFPKLVYRSSPSAKPLPGSVAVVPVPAAGAGGAAVTAGPATRPDDGPADVDFAATVALNGSSLDVGIPLTEVDGTLDLAGTVRASRLAELSGTATAQSMKLGTRSVTRFRSDLSKAADDATFRIARISADVAGGTMAGEVDLASPDDGPSQYAVDLVLRDADVGELVGGAGAKGVKGRLTASMNVGGNWNDMSSRRGRGDASVTGSDMYRVPVMLGLMQITQLSLPINQPFTSATARYNVEGQRVTFEQIDIAGKDMTMSGNGHLDYGTKKVSFTFTTDNPNMPNLPILGPLIRGAQGELMKIHVNGSVEEPKVSASSFDTITTTVDEVFKGDEKK